MSKYENRILNGWRGTNLQGDVISVTCIECGLTRSMSLSSFKNKNVKTCHCALLTTEQLKKALSNRSLNEKGNHQEVNHQEDPKA